MLIFRRFSLKVGNVIFSSSRKFTIEDKVNANKHIKIAIKNIVQFGGGQQYSMFEGAIEINMIMTNIQG